MEKGNLGWWNIISWSKPRESSVVWNRRCWPTPSFSRINDFHAWKSLCVWPWHGAEDESCNCNYWRYIRRLGGCNPISSPHPWYVHKCTSCGMQGIFFDMDWIVRWGRRRKQIEIKLFKIQRCAWSVSWDRYVLQRSREWVRSCSHESDQRHVWHRDLSSFEGCNEYNSNAACWDAFPRLSHWRTAGSSTDVGSAIWAQDMPQFRRRSRTVTKCLVVVCCNLHALTWHFKRNWNFKKVSVNCGIQPVRHWPTTFVMVISPHCWVGQFWLVNCIPQQLDHLQISLASWTVRDCIPIWCIKPQIKQMDMVCGAWSTQRCAVALYCLIPTWNLKHRCYGSFMKFPMGGAPTYRTETITPQARKGH